MYIWDPNKEARTTRAPCHYHSRSTKLGRSGRKIADVAAIPPSVTLV